MTGLRDIHMMTGAAFAHEIHKAEQYGIVLGLARSHRELAREDQQLLAELLGAATGCVLWLLLIGAMR